MAKSVASIATRIVGFPYKVEPPYAEGVVWKVHSDDELYYRTIKRIYKSNDLTLALDKKVQKKTF